MAIPSHQTYHPPLLTSKGALLAHISRRFYISYQVCLIPYEVKSNLDTTDFGYIMEDDLSNKITQLCATANTVLPNGVIVENYLSVDPSSANVLTKQLKKSLLNAKIPTHSISSFKRYWE